MSDSSDVIYLQYVILCGGKSARLFPFSNNTPKPMVSIGDTSLIEMTLYRCRLISEHIKSYITLPLILVMNKQHTLPDKLRNYKFNILLEDHANDTGVAIARACQFIKTQYPKLNIKVVIFPADHYIYNVDNFVKDLREGISKINNENIVIFGLPPDKPNVNYGYILKNPEVKSDKNSEVKFIEKPDIIMAEKLIKEGALWNAGIFGFNLDMMLHFLQQSRFHIFEWIKTPREGKAPSFDVAVLQEFNNIYPYICHNWDWSDVGSWHNFIEIPEIRQEFINNENDGEVIKHACTDVDVLNRGLQHIVVLGGKNLLVIYNDGNLLIMDKTQNYDTELKNIVIKF